MRKSDWMRVYDFIFKESQSTELKVEVVGLLGDLARIHLKFFKTKSAFRTHIENLVYVMSSIFENLVMFRDSQQTTEVSIEVGITLNKLMSSASRSVLFEINSNTLNNLLFSISRFVAEQIIG